MYANAWIRGELQQPKTVRIDNIFCNDFDVQLPKTTRT